MAASLVRVTTNGLFGAPLDPTVSGVVSAWEFPPADVAKFQVTSLGVLARQPGSDVVRALVVYPVAYVVFVGSCTAVMVTGYGFGLAIVTTTSPVAPGYRRPSAAGVAAAEMIRLEFDAERACPDEALATPTTQLVAA